MKPLKYNVVKVSCGFGNQLFQYALAYAISRQTEGKVILDALSYGAKYDRTMSLTRLNISLPVVWHPKRNIILRGAERYMKFGFLKKRKEQRSRQYDPNLFSSDSNNCYYEGYWQSYKYFQDYLQDLRGVFSLKTYSTETRQLMEHYQSMNSVAVHIRRGDYAQLGYCIPLDYYFSAIERMKMMVSAPVFIVFSDDIPWARSNLHGIDNIVFMENDKTDDVEQFFVMMSCRNFIIANSTFSYWAAILNNGQEKIVIAPYTGREGEDYYPPEFVVIPAQAE